jgi:hypothetical protein
VGLLSCGLSSLFNNSKKEQVKMKKLMAIVTGIGTSLMVGTGQVMAAVDLSTVDVDDSNIAPIALAICTALGVLWGVRKVVKTLNRS